MAAALVRATFLVNAVSASCGTATPLVFTIASDDQVGTNVGRFGELRLFICPEHHQTFQADVY